MILSQEITFFALLFHCRKYRCIFHHFYGPNSYRIRWNKANYGHYAVQGHSRSPILVTIDSPYATSCNWLILTYLLSCTVSQLYGRLFVKFLASDRGVPHFNALARSDPLWISGSTLLLQKLEWLFYSTLKTARSYLYSSWQNTGKWRKDRRTDRQNRSGYCIASNAAALYKTNFFTTSCSYSILLIIMITDI